MRSGGKGMWGRGPALYKPNLKKISTNKPKKTSACTEHGHLVLSKLTIKKYQHTYL
jgi:hypothetical protein